MEKHKEKWTEKDVRMVAAEAEADLRTVRKVMEGRFVRGMVADRIKKALRERGMAA